MRGRRVKKSVIGLTALPVDFVVDFGMVALDKARPRATTKKEGRGVRDIGGP